VCRRRPRGAVRVEGAGLVAGAIGEEGLERLLEPDGLLLLPLVRLQRRVDGAVEDERADVRGKDLGIHRPQVGAVGETEVGEFRFAEGLADLVDVASDRLRGDEREQAAALFAARLRELPGNLGERIPFSSGIGRRVGVVEGVKVVQAIDGGALAGPAGVEADDVEAVAQLAPELPRLALHEVDTGPAGPAGIDDERAQTVGAVGRGQAGEGDLDVAGGLPGVVEGHGQSSAFELRRARLPGEGGPGRGTSRGAGRSPAGRGRCGRGRRYLVGAGDKRGRSEEQGGETAKPMRAHGPGSSRV